MHDETVKNTEINILNSETKNMNVKIDFLNNMVNSLADIKL